MARRLEKIEKEMGYCDVKLEKERRARTQAEFIRGGLEAVDRLAAMLQPHDVLLHPREVRLRPGEAGRGQERPTREAFLAAGLLDLLQEKRRLLERELEEITSRLPAYDGFHEKKKRLEEEKRALLRSFRGGRSGHLRKLNNEFKKIEASWNMLTEDLGNLEAAIGLVDRSLDYLRSARTFLISARGGYEVETWRRAGYLTDLFRHSNIGRAREMAAGADRNLEAAQSEIACMAGLRRSDSRIVPGSPSYVEVLIPFVEALYDDIFVHAQIERTIQVIEAGLAGNLKLIGLLKARRDVTATRLEQAEKARTELFHRMGTRQRRELSA